MVLFSQLFISFPSNNFSVHYCVLLFYIWILFDKTMNLNWHYRKYSFHPILHERLPLICLEILYRCALYCITLLTFITHKHNSSYSYKLLYIYLSWRILTPPEGLRRDLGQDGWSVCCLSPARARQLHPLPYCHDQRDDMGRLEYRPGSATVTSVMTYGWLQMRCPQAAGVAIASSWAYPA